MSQFIRAFIKSAAYQNLTTELKIEALESMILGGSRSLKLVTQSDEIAAIVAEAYEDYPRHEGRTKGMQKLLPQIKTVEEAHNLWTAVHNYAKRKAGTDKKFLLMWSTFAGQWRDWLDADNGDISGESREDAEYRILQSRGEG